MSNLRKRIDSLILYGNYLLKTSFSEYEFKIFEAEVLSIKAYLETENLFSEYTRFLQPFRPGDYKITINTWITYFLASLYYEHFNFYLSNTDHDIAKRYILDMMAHFKQMLHKH